MQQEAKKAGLDRIIVKDNNRMGQLIKWYFENQEYLESQTFLMPFVQGLICLCGEKMDVSFEVLSETDVRMKIYPMQKDIVMVTFHYDPVRDFITAKEWPKHLMPGRLGRLQEVEAQERLCKKQAFKFRVLMFYAVYYKNEIVIDPKQEKRLDKHTRNSLKKKGHKTPLVRNTYILEPDAVSLKKPADPEKKRHYEKPEHEVRVRGYRRKNGTWVAPYTRYKDKGEGDGKTYKA